MSRHNKYADDSARLSLVVPKYLKEKMIDQCNVSRCAISDIARSCLLVGFDKLYESKKQDEKKQ